MLPGWRERAQDEPQRQSHPAQPQDWLHLPELQSSAKDHERGECRTAADVQSCHQCRRAQAACHRALKAVGLGERLYHKSNQMSGGQMQRVAIARALVNNPAVILADEATGNLDTRTSFEILVLFQKLYAEGRTIIFVTHNPDIAKYSSRNIELRDGHIISDTYNDNILSAAEGLAALPANTDE
nr:ATP-binding cassette domain-containing protein [Prevotella sp. AM34-19LB]